MEEGTQAGRHAGAVDTVRDLDAFLAWRHEQRRRRRLILSGLGAVILVVVGGLYGLAQRTTPVGDGGETTDADSYAVTLTEAEYWRKFVDNVLVGAKSTVAHVPVDRWLEGDTQQPTELAARNAATHYRDSADRERAFGTPPVRLKDYHDALIRISYDRARLIEMAWGSSGEELDGYRARWRQMAEELTAAMDPVRDGLDKFMSEEAARLERQNANKLFEGVNLAYKVTERGQYLWQLSWRVDVRNLSERRIVVDVFVRFLDAERFVVYEDSEYDVPIDAWATRGVSDTVVLSPELARTVADIEGDVRLSR